MMPLPRGLRIDRDLEEEQSLMNKARAHLDKDGREGIHASDLLNLRLAFFRRTKPSPLPDRLVNMFIVGQVAHAIIEVIKGSGGDYTTPDAGTKLFGELRYSPDFFNLRG